MYNGQIYSKVLGNFDVFVGTRPWTKEDVMGGSAFGSDGDVQQRLCLSNTDATPLSGDKKYDYAWNKNMECNTPLPGSWVTIVLRPMSASNLQLPFVAAQQPKDTRRLGGGGFDSDNPTSITEATSPRFLVLSEIAVCES